MLIIKVQVWEGEVKITSRAIIYPRYSSLCGPDFLKVLHWSSLRNELRARFATRGTHCAAMDRVEDLISNLDSNTHETELLCLSSREPGVAHQEPVWQLRRVEQLLVRRKGCKLGWSQASNLAVESDGRYDFRVSLDH